MSMPQFRTLFATASERWPALQIVAASSEPDDVFLPYVARHQLSFKQMLRLQGTHTEMEKMVVPSMLLADAGGVVIQTWLGALTESRVTEVIAALETGLAPTGGK